MRNRFLKIELETEKGKECRDMILLLIKAGASDFQIQDAISLFFTSKELPQPDFGRIMKSVSEQ